MKYYELRDNVHYLQRWHLGDIIEVDDNWIFVYGVSVDEKGLPNDLYIQLQEEGIPLDYSTNGAFSVPIVSEKVKMQLGGVKDVQFIPVSVIGNATAIKYFIMVATKLKECVDEARSEFGKFVENDPIRPDKAGEYSFFTRLVIDPTKLNGEDIFRIVKARSCLIVSERVKEALADVGVTGTDFTEV